MWDILSSSNKSEYKKMILTFASLTELFAQKVISNDQATLTPIVNSKYQETVFQKIFGATLEDIGNTSYDATISNIDSNGNETKYLIGIKTFGYNSGAQKIAQFKANIKDWSDIINDIRINAKALSDTTKDKKALLQKINNINHDLYLKLAIYISQLRNLRLESSEANLQGFSIFPEKDTVESIYHVLMPSNVNNKPVIYVGEAPYDKIDINSIQILGCTGVQTPANFDFTDGNHKYRFTSADSQLLMHFDNKNIVKEKWDVTYADDAYSIFSKLGEEISEAPKQNIIESYSWKLTNKDGEIEKFSGFNSFYGVGSKLGVNKRTKKIDHLENEFKTTIDNNILDNLIKLLSKYLLTKSNNYHEKAEKLYLREKIIDYASTTNNQDFINAVNNIVFRPAGEMYIPIPNARKFHENNPLFFGNNLGQLKPHSKSLLLNKTDRCFNLIFEPSGKMISCYISEDYGKSIKSIKHQTILGKWLLHGVFQLKEYEPLTPKKLHSLGINGMRLYKTDVSNDIHIKFIWIDDDNLPEDYWK